MNSCAKYMAETIFGPRGAVFDCYPGGNDTFLVLNPVIRRERYPEVNRTLLRAFPGFEQGGFIESARDERTVARLQMAGGEFCANACRSAAALIAQEYTVARRFGEIVRYDRISISECGLSFALEVSGASGVIETKVVPGSDGFDVSARIPITGREDLITRVGLCLEGRELVGALVRLDGITHLIMESAEIAFDPGPAIVRSRMAACVAQLGLESESAVGMVWLNMRAGIYSIDPIVWVRSTNTCYYESACGSGTIAAALVTAQSRTFREVAIDQPSGSRLSVSILNNPTDGLITALEGPVRIRGELSDSDAVRRVRTGDQLQEAM